MEPTLPLLRVKTRHSEYLIDQAAGTYVRTRVHEDASDLSNWGVVSGEPVAYRELMSSLEPGGALCIVHSDGTFVRSTAIVSVERINSAEEAA